MSNREVEFNFEVPQELYAKLAYIAAQRHCTVEELILSLVEQNVLDHRWLFDQPPGQ